MRVSGEHRRRQREDRERGGLRVLGSRHLVERSAPIFAGGEGRGAAPCDEARQRVVRRRRQQRARAGARRE